MSTPWYVSQARFEFGASTERAQAVYCYCSITPKDYNRKQVEVSCILLESAGTAWNNRRSTDNVCSKLYFKLVQSNPWMTQHFRFDRTTRPAVARKLFQALEWHSIWAIENTVIIKPGFVRICHHRKDQTRVHTKIATIFQGLFKDFSRVTLDFQGPPTRNIISQIVHKCTFPVYSNKALRLELFASPTSLHFSVHLS